MVYKHGLEADLLFNCASNISTNESQHSQAQPYDV